jgi:hypothetical protein
MGDSGGSVVSVDIDRISFGGKVRAPPSALLLLPFLLESANSVLAWLISAGTGEIWLAALELPGRRIERSVVRWYWR